MTVTTGGPGGSRNPDEEQDRELLRFLADNSRDPVPGGTRMHGWQTIGKFDVLWAQFGNEKTLTPLVLGFEDGSPIFKRYTGEPSRRWYPKTLPYRLIRLAVVIAGHKRTVVNEEWQSHIAGQTGHNIPLATQLRAALGFVRAAIRYRIQDAFDITLRPVDSVLKSRGVSGLFVVLATLAYVFSLMSDGGGTELSGTGLRGNAGNIVAVASVAYGLIRAGRKWRATYPLQRKPRGDSGGR